MNLKNSCTVKLHSNMFQWWTPPSSEQSHLPEPKHCCCRFSTISCTHTFILCFHQRRCTGLLKLPGTMGIQKVGVGIHTIFCVYLCVFVYVMPTTCVHSVQQKSVGLKCCTSFSGSDMMMYSCYYNLSCLTFSHICAFVVFLSFIHYEQSHHVYINQRHQYICLI
jgi:hypothetical protein